MSIASELAAAEAEIRRLEAELSALRGEQDIDRALREAGAEGQDPRTVALLRATLQPATAPTPSSAPDACPACGRPWPTEQRVAALHAEGLAAEEIAAQLDLKPRRVQQVLKAAGLAAPRGRRARQLPACPSAPSGTPTTS